MYKQQNNNVTYIDDLPELDEIETQGGGGMDQGGLPEQYHQVPSKYQKFIRHSHNTPLESGMAPPGYPVPNEQMMEEEGPHPAQLLRHTPTCLEIAEHVSMCPICSRFYNNDKTIYIIAIIMLSIICILLLKRVLDL